MKTTSEAEDESAQRLMGQVVEEFLERQAAGEQPDVESYARRYPQLGDVLRQMLPALQLMQMPSVGHCAEGEPPVLTGCLGDFRLVREIGHGGMGVVYEAEQISLGRRVALKVLPFASTLDARQLQRFKNEAQAAAHLHHTNIVPVFATGCERGVHYYAMQLIDGHTLTALIHEMRQQKQGECDATGPYLPSPVCADGNAATPPVAALSTQRAVGADYFRRVARLGVQAAQGLDHAHQLGVIHRDVKPGNLMVDGSGNLWITDFGLAHCQSQASLTMTGDLVGTLRYMSPEQALAQRVVVDHRTDVYSLGATLYELLTLEPAFNGQDQRELLRQIAFEEPVPPRRLNRAIPAELEIVVGKAMEKNPADRYGTAQEMADDLERWLRDEPIRARRPTLLQRGRKWARRHRPVVASLAVGLVAMLVVGVVAAFGYQRRLAETDRGVTAALAQAETYLSEGDRQTDHPKDWQATTRLALAAVQNAEGLLAAGAATAALARRVEQVRAAVDAAVADSGLRVELDRIHLEQAATVKDDRFDQARAAPMYAKAVADYGIDLAEPEVAAARVRGSRLRDVLLAALHEWALITKDAGERRQLEAVLHAAEPKDTFRMRWLAASRRGDKAALVKLAMEPQAQQLPIADIARLGRDLHVVKEWAAAERLLRPAQARKPGDFWLNHNLGMVLTEQGRSGAAEAVGFLRVALGQRSDSPGVYLNLGSALSRKGDEDGAILCYQAALQIDPNYATAHHNLGVALRHKGQLDQAIARYRQAIRINKDHPLAYNALGVALDKQGKLDKAIAVFRKALTITNTKDPDDVRVNLANSLTKKGLLDEALAESEKVIAINKDHARAQLVRGNVLHKQGKLEGAIAAYRKALAIQKDYVEAHGSLGNALRDNGQLDAAIAEFKKIIAINKDDAKAHHGLGNALKDNGQLGAAIAEFKKIIAIQKDYVEAYCCLGNALKDNGQLDAAIAACQKAIDLQPRNVEAHSILGCALCEKGDLPRAIDACKKAIDLQPDFYEAYRNLGTALMAKGDLPGAIAAYRKAISIKKDYASAYHGLGIALSRQGNLNEAIAAYQEAIAINWAATGLKEDFAEAHCNLGNALRRQRKFNEAIAAYLEAIRLKPDFAEAYNGLGGILSDHNHDYDWAIPAFEAASCFQPDKPEYRNSLGNALLNKGRLPEAIAAYREAIRLKKDFLWAHHNLGLALATNGQVEEAIKAYREAIRLNKDFAVAHDSLGNVLRVKGQVDEAIAAYREAIRLNKDNPGYHNNLGVALDDKGLLEEAIAEYREAIRLKKDYPEAHNNLGFTLHAKGQLEEAIKEYRQAIRLKPDYAYAHNNLGNALLAKGQLEEAIAEYREAIRLKPDYAVAHNGLGNVLQDKGQVEEAIAEYREAIRLKPDYAFAHTGLGNARYAKGQVEEAIAAYREAIRLNKDYALAHHGLGIALHAKGLLEEAIAAYREAIRIQKNYPKAHNNLGVTLHAKGQLEEAIKEYRQAIRLKPDYAYAHNNLGNALRAKGQLDEAIAAYREAIRLNKDYAEAYCNLGHALVKKCQFHQAVEALQRGHELGIRRADWPYPSASWLRQAEKLARLDVRLPAVLAGKDKPKNAAEHLDFALLCQRHRHRYAAAARLYAEAFAAQPTLADNLQKGHRYNAACAAALAGCGKGEEGFRLPEQHHSKWRKQALTWLQADLDAWRRLFEKDPDKVRPVIIGKMQHWQSDADFAGLRGQEALARLPDSERLAWQKLWAGVRETLFRAQPNARWPCW
jgi:tetratricopeptide (TPR) repeat protein